MSDSAKMPLRFSLDEVVMLTVGLKVLNELVETIEINGLPQEALMGELLGKLEGTLTEDLVTLSEEIVEDILEGSLSLSDSDDLAAMTADSSYGMPMYAVDAHLPVIEQAIEASRSLDVTYFSMSREEFSDRRIDPFGLKKVGDLFWLVAYCHLRGDRRVFRLDRIKTMALSEASFERPQNFTLGEYFDESES